MFEVHGLNYLFMTSFLDRKCDHCDPNARCLDGFKCSCNEGYQGDGQDCQSTFRYSEG